MKICGLNLLPSVTSQVLGLPVIRYLGVSKEPRWMDEEEGGRTDLRSSIDNRI